MVRRTSRSRSSVRSVCVNIFWDTPPIARRSSPCRLAPRDSSYRMSSPHLLQILVNISWTLTTRLCSTSEDLLRSSQLRTAVSLSWVREYRRHCSSAIGPIVRQKLRNGRLPSKRAASIFGRPGAGGRCGACNRELRSTQLVMELPTFDGRVLFVHGDCFIVWDAERAALWPSVVGVR